MNKIVIQISERTKDLSLLFVRLLLAYGFLNPAMMKIKNFDSIVEWFDSMGLPFPMVNAALATATESFGVILLTLGLGIRFISIPLIIVMVVAIVSVHLNNGFEASENGFEIPLYYIGMLITLFSFGSGKFGLDYWIVKK